jgi:hypothetical protein
MSTTPINRLRAMVDTDRVTGRAVELLGELDGDTIRELADNLTAIADAADDAGSAVEEWQEAEREDKADTREAALDALGTLVEAWDAVDFMELPSAVVELIAGAGDPELLTDDEAVARAAAAEELTAPAIDPAELDEVIDAARLVVARLEALTAEVAP